MGIRHKFRSPISDDGIPSGEVKPSNWNDEHEVDGYLGAMMSLPLAANSIAYVDGDKNPQLAIVTAIGLAILAGNTPADVLSYLGGATLANAALTGAPTAPTPAAGDNSTRIATMEAVQTAVANLVASSPAALDTLNELATALGNDPNFATTMTTALGYRLRFDAVQSLTAPQLSQARSNLGLGTVVTYNVGVGAGNIVQLDGSAKLPGVDGSALVNVTVTWGNVTGAPTFAPLNSPNLTGAPTAPTPANGDNSTALATTAFVQSGLAGVAGVFGQCRLEYYDATHVILRPCRGALLTVNGVACSIPSAGVLGVVTGLTPSTNYYVYAVATGAAITALEFSATGHTMSGTGGNVGNEVKAGDETRTLVGMVRVIVGPAFSDTLKNRFVRSWHNRRAIQTGAAFATQRSTASLTFVELNSEIQLSALLWADEVWSLTYTGDVYNAGGTVSVTATGLAIDSTTSPSAITYQNAGTSVSIATPVQYDFQGIEGQHYATILGRVSGGTGNWEVSSVSSGRLSGVIR